MGGVVRAIGDVFSGIGRAVSSIVEGAGKVISGVVSSIGKDPLTFIAKAAAIATGQLWAIPVIDGVSTLAKGGSIGDALKATAASAVATWATGGFGGEGLGIARAVGGGTLGTIANQAAHGVISTGIRTGNIEAALTAGLTSAVSAGVGAGIGQLGLGDALGTVGIGAVGTQLISGAASGAIRSAIRGGDVAEGAGAGLAGGLFNWGSRTVNDVVSGSRDFLNDYGASEETLARNDEVGALGNQLQDISREYSDTQAELRAQYEEYQSVSDTYNNAMAEHRARAEEARVPYEESRNQLQAKIDAYNAVRTQYDAAYAARNGDEVTRLGNELNALAEDANTYSANVFTPEQERYQAVVNEVNAHHQENIESYDRANELGANLQTGQQRLTELQQQATTVGEDFNAKSAALAEEAQALQDEQELAALAKLNESQGATDASGNTDWSRLFTGLGAAPRPGARNRLRPAIPRAARPARGGPSPGSPTEGATDASGNSVGSGTSGLIRPLGDMMREYMARQAGRSPNAAPGEMTAGQHGSFGGIPGALAAGTLAFGGAGLAHGANASGALPGALPPAQPQIVQNTAPQDYDLFGFMKGGTKLINIPGLNQASQNQLSTYGNQSGQGGIPQAGASPSANSVSDWFNNPFGTDVQTAGARTTDQFGLDQPYAAGGPVFLSEGGMRHVTNHVRGDGDGTSDSIEALLSSGEYVIPAQVVSMLGNGDNEAGAKKLDEFVSAIRTQKRENDPGELEPDALPPAQYLKEH